jgi:hypothetical protein
VSGNWWANKVGNPTPQRQAPPPQTVQQQPWWSPQQPTPPQPEPQYAPPGSQVLYDAQGNAVLVGANGQVLSTHQMQQGDPLAGRRLPPSASRGDRCPECGSGDYAITGKGFNKSSGSFDVWKCFDCGYPVKQEFSGMSDITGGQAVGKAQQVAHGGLQSNYAPQQTQAPSFAAEQGGPGR